MGFRITWSLIAVGLKQYDSLEPQLAYEDLFDYIKENIGSDNVEEDKYLAVLIHEGDIQETKKAIERNKVGENTNEKFEMRKWRALELSELLLDEENYSLLVTKLYDFWLSFAFLDDSFKMYPKDSVEFLSRSNKDVINDHIEWLKNETSDIISTESL
ncbi:MAG: DUF2247 family protein [Clostridia bacterium]|nr:DUF2247 family protein [Clostridia bacterium]